MIKKIYKVKIENRDEVVNKPYEIKIYYISILDNIITYRYVSYNELQDLIKNNVKFGYVYKLKGGVKWLLIMYRQLDKDSKTSRMVSWYLNKWGKNRSFKKGT